jgi:hypothetical protein
MWLSNILQILPLLLLLFQHRERPYCNGCYQKLFGPDGYRPGSSSIEPRKVLKRPKAESGDLSAAERSVLLAAKYYMIIVKPHLITQNLNYPKP